MRRGVSISGMGGEVVGEHLERIPLAMPAREWRRLVNLATTTRLRATRPHGPIERAAVRYPKVFVVGCGRSGTSWVQSIVAMGPRVVTTQESHAYEVVYGNVAAGDHRNPLVWTKVLHRHDLAEREQRWVGLHWWIERAALCDLIGRAMHVHNRDAADVAEDVVEAIFDHRFFANGGTAEHTLLEKTPGHLAYAEQILRRYPEAKVIEVMRDGRDVCVSMQMQALTMRWPPKQREAQIDSWLRAVRRGLELRRTPELRDRVHLVRYEDLKADPQREIAALYGFLGFPASDAEIEQVGDRSDFRHHRQTGAGRHTRRGEVGDWRNHFSPDDETLFEAKVGALFEELGYRY